MSDTWKQSPEIIRQRQELRRGGAAGTHGGGKRERNRRDRKANKVDVRSYR